MSSTQAEPVHDTTTQQRFRDLLDELTTRGETTDFPEKKRYTIQDPATNNGSRVNIHYKALTHSPLSDGDMIEQYYFADYGMVILNLNPSQ